MTSPKQLAKIYRLAAERIAEGKEEYCCDAISIICMELKLSDAEASDLFKAKFKPADANFLWWDRDDQESRIIALLLMAEIVEHEKE